MSHEMTSVRVMRFNRNS